MEFWGYVDHVDRPTRMFPCFFISKGYPQKCPKKTLLRMIFLLTQVGPMLTSFPGCLFLPTFFCLTSGHGNLVPMVLYPWIIQESGHLGETSNFMRLWLHNLHTSQTFCFSGSVTFLKFQKKRKCVKTFWNLPGCVTIKWVVSKFDVYFSRLCFQRRFFFWEAMHSSKFWFMNQPDVRPKRMFWVLGFWVG